MASVGEIYRTTLNYTTPNSSTPQNVFYHQLATPAIDDVEVKLVLADFFTLVFAPEWAEMAATQANMDYGQVDVINNAGLLVRALGTFTIDVPGLLAFDTSPAAVAAFMMAETAEPKVRGRKYLPGVSEVQIDQGAFNTAALTTLSTLLLLYLGTITNPGDPTMVPGVISRTLGAFVPFEPSGLVNDIPAYQRRRKPGVGS